MRKVTCASCGRPYDYDSDDFCPKCGSYNPPPDRAGARPAQAPPARVSAASKDRPRPAAQPKTPPVGPRTVSYGGPQGGTPWEEPPARRQRSPLKLLVLVLVSLFLLCIVLPFVLGLMLNLSEAFAGRRPEPGAVAQAEPAGGTHALWEPFSIHGTQQVTVEDPWEVDLTYVPLARREGFRCLAVDLWVEGGISGHPLRRPVGGPPVRPDDLLCPRGCLRRGRAGFVRGGAGQQHPLCRPSDSPGAALGRGRNRVKRSKSD